MIDLFTQRIEYVKGVASYGQMDFIRKTFNDKIIALKQHYERQFFYSRNDHILVSIIKHAIRSFKPSYRDYVESCLAQVDALNNMFRLTCSYNYGEIKNHNYGVFYGQGSAEFILSHEEEFDIEHSVLNWRDLKPVTIISHPVSDLYLTLPNGKNNHFLEGLTFIKLDIPLLMFQFRRYVENTFLYNKTNNTEVPVSPKLFIYKHVLPNMMYSHLDHVFLNRYMARTMGYPFTVPLTKSSFYQVDNDVEEGKNLSRVINSTQLESIKRIRNMSQYEQYLTSIETVFSENAYRLLELPDVAPTRQVTWFILLSRLKHLIFLFETSQNIIKDQGVKNEVSLTYKRLLASQSLERALPPSVLEGVLFDIKHLISLC